MATTPGVPPAPPPVSGCTRQIPIPACSLTVEDLRRLFQLLEAKASEAADAQVATLQQGQGQTDEQFQQLKHQVRSLLKLVASIQGISGEWTAGMAQDVFHPESLPHTLAGVHYDSAFLYRGQTHLEPNNSFFVSLEFTRTSILDLTNLSVAPSQVQNFVRVTGVNQTWVNGVIEELRTFFVARAATRGWLHYRFTYDVLLLLVGFPLTLNLVYHSDRLLSPLLKLPEALFVVLYVYLTLLLLLAFRILFNYAKWVFPKVEGPSSLRGGARLHKTILTIIAGGMLVRLVSSFLWIIGIRLH